jgi:hypothetical protein
LTITASIPKVEDQSNVDELVRITVTEPELSGR